MQRGIEAESLALLNEALTFIFGARNETDQAPGLALGNRHANRYMLSFNSMA